MKRIKWLITNGLGRYALGGALALTGVFSQYGTIELIRTDWALFEYTSAIGIAIASINFGLHIGSALVKWLEK